MTGRSLGLALALLGAVPAGANAADWRLIDTEAICYHMHRSNTTIRCTAVATFTSAAGYRMVCTAFARRYPGPVTVECEAKPPGYQPLRMDYRTMSQLTSNPPYVPAPAETEWRIDGSLVVGCIIWRSDDQSICASTPALP